jgi:hypothetical protein
MRFATRGSSRHAFETDLSASGQKPGAQEGAFPQKSKTATAGVEPRRLIERGRDDKA